MSRLERAPDSREKRAPILLSFLEKQREMNGERVLHDEKARRPHFPAQKRTAFLSELNLLAASEHGLFPSGKPRQQANKADDEGEVQIERGFQTESADRVASQRRPDEGLRTRNERVQG